MTDPRNPYRTLPPESFWKTAVELRVDDTFEDLWQPRFPIDPSDAILTAGSCFAQHISRWLGSNGYSWVDTEPPPAGMSEEEAAAQGHGIFSFRTGNIYSAALLRQWVFWALGKAPQAFESAAEDGRIHDLFRPAVPSSGHTSEEELRAQRDTTLRAIRAGVEQADLFIFTLGLTEAWENEHGDVYPMCPGTLHGSFDAARHRFITYDYARVRADLEATFDAIREVNPGIRFLLTVSPVPLTATAGDQHVLPATVHAKSVLRAVAGSLRADRDDVDYFPSYELIAAHPAAGRYYDENLRTVRREGVEHVMSHFARGIGAVAESDEIVDISVFCEEVRLLESARPENAGVGAVAGEDSEQTPAVPVLLFGSSHMGKLSEALTSLGVPHFGGMTMNGGAWLDGRFVLDEESYFVPLEGRDFRRRWEEALDFFELAREQPEACRIITDIGAQSHAAVRGFRYQTAWRGLPAARIPATFDDYYQDHFGPALDLAARLLREGFALTVVTDPPTQYVGVASDRSVLEFEHLLSYEQYDDEVARRFSALGCDVFLARRELADAWRPDFESATVRNGWRDWIHGSEDYYLEVARRLVDRLGLSGGDRAVAWPGTRTAVEEENAARV